jgi:hypothetical protein
MSTVATLNARIVDDLQTLADSWKSVAAELAPPTPSTVAPARKRAPSKRRARPKA